MENFKLLKIEDSLKSSLNKMMQDKIFTNYVYRTISYATTMYFWNSTFQEKLPKLRESIKKEIDP